MALQVSTNYLATASTSVLPQLKDDLLYLSKVGYKKNVHVYGAATRMHVCS